MEYLDKEKILGELTKEDVIKVVTALGSDFPKTTSSGDLIFQTVCHGSTSWKLYYYHEATNGYKGRTFHCYTKCGDSFNIIELVIRANRAKGKVITWYKALRYIGQLTGKLSVKEDTESKKDGEDDKVDTTEDFEWLRKLKGANKRHTSAPDLKEINENVLDVFYYAPYEEWLKEHISREALSRFEIGYYGLTHQITLPHRDKEGRLIGIRGRYLDDRDVEEHGKYVPLVIDGKCLKHSLGSNLYGLNVVKEKVLQCKKIMLVEAEKSCLQAYTYFGDDSFVVATCGSNITLTQRKILLQVLKVEEVIVGFDRDYHAADSYEASIWWNKMVKKVTPLLPYVRVYICADKENRLEYKMSPTDNGKDVLLELMKEKILITDEDVKRVNDNNE